MILVAIADDHRVVRVGLEQLLGTFDDVELVGAAAGGEEAVALCAAERPDVLLLDLAMPDLDGIAVTRRVAAEVPETRVVLFTSFSDRGRDRRRARRRRRRLPAEGRRAAGHPQRDPGGRARGGATGAEGGRRSAGRTRPPPERHSGTHRAGTGDPRARARRHGEQADRAQARDQREDREGTPHERVPADRRDGPDAGRDLGGAQRFVPRSRDRSPLVMTPSGADHLSMRRRLLGPILAAVVAAALFASPASAKAPVQRRGLCELTTTALDLERTDRSRSEHPACPFRGSWGRARRDLASPAVGQQQGLPAVDRVVGLDGVSVSAAWFAIVLGMTISWCSANNRDGSGDTCTGRVTF